MRIRLRTELQFWAKKPHLDIKICNAHLVREIHWPLGPQWRIITFKLRSTLCAGRPWRSGGVLGACHGQPCIRLQHADQLLPIVQPGIQCLLCSIWNPEGQQQLKAEQVMWLGG